MKKGLIVQGQGIRISRCDKGLRVGSAKGHTGATEMDPQSRALHHKLEKSQLDLVFCRDYQVGECCHQLVGLRIDVKTGLRMYVKADASPERRRARTCIL